MSLDVIMCRIVPPEEATAVYWADYTRGFSGRGFARLGRLQSSGVIPVAWERIGKNCMNDTWHRRYEALRHSDFDTPVEAALATATLEEMLILFPYELHVKLFPFIRKRPSKKLGIPGEFNGARLLEPYDFIHISW